MMGIKEGLLLIIFFYKKSTSLSDKSVSGSGVANNEIKQNLQLAIEFHKPIIRALKKEHVTLDLKTIFGVLI